jgi:hypothetical protein
MTTRRRRVAAGRLLGLLLVGGALGACAVPFGSAPEDGRPGPPATARERNRLYLEEQERIQRERQGFGSVPPSDR